MRCVQFEVEFKDADARFAEEAKLASERVLCNELTDLGRGDVAVLCDTRDLEFGGGGGNLGVEAGTGRGYEIDGNWSVRIFSVELSGIGFDAVEQLVIRGRKIRCRRIGRRRSPFLPMRAANENSPGLKMFGR